VQRVKEGPLTKLLIVDDNEQNLYMLQVLLSANGFDVEVAANGADALELAHRSPPDMIISDILMPVMDGFSLCRSWKEDARLKDIPFVFYTATYTDPRDEEFALGLGADKFIIKPVEPRELLSLLKETWDNYEAGKPVISAKPVQANGHYKEYSSVLIRKLEAKMLQLEKTNRNLESEIAERRRAEIALRESEAKIRGILDNIGIGVALISPEMEVLEVNRCMRESFPGLDHGYHPVCYRVFRDPAREVECENCPTCRTLRDGLVHEAQSSTTVGGTMRQHRIVATPVLDSSGKVTACIVMVEDITERLSLESQLLHSQKLEAVGRLAGGMAHDVNNMLSVILGCAELALLKSEPTSPLRSYLKEILNATGRSSSIIRKLLTFARKQTIAPKVLDLNEAVESMLKVIRRLIGEDIDLVWLPESSPCPVKMDPTQIEQVLVNLCINARDAIAGVGKVTIETGNTVLDEAYCSVHAGAATGDYAMLAVSDDGCGMDRETLDKIFEPFFSTKEAEQGTGLGLSTVYGIVKQNRGFINVYSEKGSGTTFKIHLPRQTSVSAEDRKEKDDVLSRSLGETVLVVEDEISVLNLASGVLEGLGYTVLTAATPGEALRIVEDFDGDIHLLLTDVILPELNGRDLAEQITKLRPTMKCLFMSGYTADVIAHRGMLGESVHFITKPFSLRDLADKVRTALGDGG
jgi:two-component system cell cycle sensor histidine kinase/response regulator CckA